MQPFFDAENQLQPGWFRHQSLSYPAGNQWSGHPSAGNASTQVLFLINGKEQRLAPLFIEVKNLFLNDTEHAGFPTFVG